MMMMMMMIHNNDDDYGDLVLQGKDAVPPVTPSTVDPGEPELGSIMMEIFHNLDETISHSLWIDFAWKYLQKILEICLILDVPTLMDSFIIMMKIFHNLDKNISEL